MKNESVRALKLPNFLSCLVLLPLLCGALSNSVRAQSEARVLLRGQVIDTEGTPLPGAAIYAFDLREGVSSDSRGEFSLLLPDTLVNIEVALLGFEKKSLRIRPSEEELLIIELTPLVFELPTSTISADRVLAVFQDPEIAVIDFQFLGNELIVLARQGKKWMLYLLDTQAEIKNSVELQKKGKSLYKDCFGRLHVLYEEGGEEVLLRGSDLFLINPFTQKQFESLLLPCAGSTGHSLLFREFSRYNQAAKISEVDRLTGERREVYSIEDEVAIDVIRTVHTEIRQYRELIASGEVTDAVDLLQIQRKIMQCEWLLDQLLYKEIYLPLFVTDTEIHVFDHLNAVWNVFDHAWRSLSQVKLEYVNNKKWEDEILHDELNNSFYTFFRSAKFLLISRIMEDGSVDQSGQKVNVLFPERSKVYGGSLWYIFQGKDDQTPELYRQILND